MATGYQNRRNIQQREPEQSAADKVADQQRGLEQVEEGQELSTEQAAKVGAQFGNAALAALLGSAGKAGQGADVEASQEQEEQVEEIVEVEEEVGGELDLDAPQFGGGGGGALPPSDNGSGDGSGDNPWDVGKLFGGDDDDDDPLAPTRMGRLGPSPRRQMQAPDDELFADERSEEDPAALQPEELSGIDLALLSTPPRSEVERTGDSVYLAVEPAFEDALQLGRHELIPEDLIDRQGMLDPVNRPTEIGRFLAESGADPRARSLGRVLSRAAAALAPAPGGFAGAVARMGSLAVCAEALEGGGARTDRAVSLALAFDAWPQAVEMARPMAQEGRLHAPEVLDALLGGEAASGGRIPEASLLGGRALARLVPEPYLPEIPLIDLGSAEPEVHEDAELAAFDAILAEFSSGIPDPSAGERVRPEVLAPALHGARYLMNAVGRAHVELAAAALAVWEVRPEAPVRGPLQVSDKALIELARTVLRAGRRIEKSQDRDRAGLEEEDLHAAARQLRDARLALLGLREWAFESIAGALDA